MFFDILRTLEAIEAPYMVIGAFAAILYGSTRTTFDIDIVVDLSDEHVQALTDAYPPPRYYADPFQMRDSIKMGIMFNIIDTSMGEKADLVPLSMEPRYRFAFQHRVRQTVEPPDGESFEIWCGRAEDIVVGKLMAWEEGRSRKHETDIYEMMLFSRVHQQSSSLDEVYIDQQAKQLGEPVLALWQAIRQSVDDLK